jgi:hypothetical protein
MGGRRGRVSVVHDRILAVLRGAEAGMRAPEVSRLARVAKRTARAALAELLLSGRVIRSGHRTRAYWGLPGAVLSEPKEARRDQVWDAADEAVNPRDLPVRLIRPAGDAPPIKCKAPRWVFDLARVSTNIAARFKRR